MSSWVLNSALCRSRRQAWAYVRTSRLMEVGPLAWIASLACAFSSELIWSSSALPVPLIRETACMSWSTWWSSG